jgi:hypothetical protein
MKAKYNERKPVWPKEIMKLLLGVLLISFGALSEENPSVLKEGMWSIRTEFTEHPSGMHSVVMTSYCRNHAQEERSKTKQPCKTLRETSSGGTHSKETECSGSGGTVVKMKFTATGDSSVHVETRVLFNPSTSGRTDSVAIVDQKYVGTCPAGVEPGDIMDAGGKVIHHGK